jgi:hypothetical protein
MTYLKQAREHLKSICRRRLSLADLEYTRTLGWAANCILQHLEAKELDAATTSDTGPPTTEARFEFPSEPPLPSMIKLTEHLNSQLKETAHTTDQRMFVALGEKTLKLQAVINKLGSWASAAQDCPDTCQELKDIFNEVLELADPEQAYADEGPAGKPGDEGPDGIGEVIYSIKYAEVIEVFRTLNDIIPLAELVYNVRDNEGRGWYGPKVVAWGDACEKLRKLSEEH